MQSKPPTTETEEVAEPIAEESSEGTVVVPPAAPEIVVPPVVPPAPALQIDYREKFGMSTREVQVLQGELQALDRQLGEITKEEIPTDEEMVQKYPEYEFAEPLMQSVLKRQEVQDRRAKGIQLSVGRMLGSVSRRNELAGIVATNPALAGKEARFLDFATDPKRSNAPVETLVSAFLFEVKDETPEPVLPPVTPPAPTPAPAPSPEPATPATALERGTPNGGEAPQPAGKKEMSPEELQALRVSDPRKYNDMVRTGQI